MNKKYTVFVSSTYEDLKEERQEVMQALLEMDCIPCGMELFPASDEKQFEFIKSIIDDCDYYVLILAGKYGSTNQDGISYTELEYNYALEKNIPIISFIHNNIGSLQHSKCEQDEIKIEKLKLFNDLAKKKLCKFWETKEQLGGLVSRSMIQLIKSHPTIGWVRANQVSNEETLKKITQLYEENRELKTYHEQNPSINNNLLVDKYVDVVLINNENKASFTKKIGLNEIFKKIGSTLVEAQPRRVIHNRVFDFFYQEYHNEISKTYKTGYSYISDDSLSEILIQLVGLNYITVNHTNNTYSLTELGLKFYFRLS